MCHLILLCLIQPEKYADIPEHCPLAEPERLPGVDDNVVEVGDPRLDVGHVKEVSHDGVGVPPLRVGQQEGLGSGLGQSAEQLWQPLVFGDVFLQLGHGGLLQVALHMDVVDGVAAVLEHRLERDEQVAALEPILGSVKITIFSVPSVFK